MGMAGQFDYGHGRVEKHSAVHIFSGAGVNIPSPDKGQWVVRGLQASGVLADPSVVTEDRVTDWFRSDIFLRAANINQHAHS
jgi:hypothetical protein